jgi:hypothetical protein
MASEPGDPPLIADISVSITPDAGGDPHPHSIQVTKDTKIGITWSSHNATGVRIDGIGTFEDSGTTTLPAAEASYSIVAIADGVESDPWLLEVHLHEDDEVVSQHMEVEAPPVQWIVNFRVSNA